MTTAREEGQTGAEYAGILLLIGLVVVALHAGDLPGRIRGGVETAVCSILGGDDCGAETTASTGTGGGDDGGQPLQGPPLDHAPNGFPVLPFPGQVGVSCTQSAVGPKGGPNCQPGQGPFDFGTQVQGEVNHGEEQLGSDGCPTTTLGVSGTLQTYGTVSEGGEQGSVTLGANQGLGVDYDVTTTPDRADEFASGESDLPNPSDPRTLEPGEGLEFDQRYYAGLKAKATYRDLQASLGFERGRELSSGVTKLDGDTVRIYVGDSDYVSNAIGAGVQVGDATIGLNASSTFSEGEMQAIDVDISTPAGWAAYQEFAQSGAVPEAGTPGTSNPTTAETASASVQSSFGAQTDNLDLQFEAGGSDGTRTVITDEDGNVTWAWSGTNNGRGVDVIHHEDAEGNQIAPSEYAINLEDVPAGVLEEYGATTGQETTGGDGTIRLEYTEEELLDLQQAAAEVQQEELAPYYDGNPPSTEEIIEQVSSDPYGSFTLPGGGEIGYASDYLALLSGQTPDEIALQLSNAGFGGPSEVLSMLSALAGDRARVRAENGEPFDRGDEILPGEQVVPSCD